MKKIRRLTCLLICLSMFTACGKNTYLEAEISDEQKEEVVKNLQDNEGEEIDYTKIAQVYLNQLNEDYNEAKTAFHITKEEYGLNYNSYSDMFPIETELLFKLEDINNDDICELLEIVTTGQKERYVSMQDELDVIAVRAYSYDDGKTKRLYNNWDFYPMRQMSIYVLNLIDIIISFVSFAFMGEEVCSEKLMRFYMRTMAELQTIMQIFFIVLIRKQMRSTLKLPFIMT